MNEAGSCGAGHRSGASEGSSRPRSECAGRALLTVERLQVLNLRPVSFMLGAGECIALEGPSGSGKSLLLRALADLDPATGTIVLDGVAHRSMSGPAWRRKVRYFAAEPGWWRDRVSDNLQRVEDAKPLLDAAGLPADALTWSLERASTGEKQRLALVRGLLDHPRVLLLDEPTSSLDGPTAHKVEALIGARLDGREASAIIVTHDPAQARRLAKRRLAIRAGALVEIDP